ncbi:MAG: Mur ligase family protein, partial [Candidatus Saccharimonadales bacterium]|nr:Mur ligase family protein [Candidatus Saccharimonadales bacterium]
MKLFVIWIGKTVLLGLRLFRKSGTALPGLIAERMYPSLMRVMLRKLPHGVVLVTGTNGKTTTTKIISELFESQGLRVLSNSSGSNFTRGVFSAIVRHSTWFGRLEFDVAVFELDEAYSRLFAKQVKPRVVLVTNILRDQLDRYGEIDTTANHIRKAISYSGGAILNADDPPVAAMGDALKDPSKVRYYGVSASLRKYLPSDEEMHGKEAPELDSAPPKHT